MTRVVTLAVQAAALVHPVKVTQVVLFLVAHKNKLQVAAVALVH